jgi:hypothetical protein
MGAYKGRTNKYKRVKRAAKELRLAEKKAAAKK